MKLHATVERKLNILDSLCIKPVPCLIHTSLLLLWSIKEVCSSLLFSPLGVFELFCPCFSPQKFPNARLEALNRVVRKHVDRLFLRRREFRYSRKILLTRFKGVLLRVFFTAMVET